MSKLLLTAACQESALPPAPTPSLLTEVQWEWSAEQHPGGHLGCQAGPSPVAMPMWLVEMLDPGLATAQMSGWGRVCSRWGVEGARREGEAHE